MSEQSSVIEVFEETRRARSMLLTVGTQMAEAWLAADEEDRVMPEDTPEYLAAQEEYGKKIEQLEKVHPILGEISVQGEIT